MLACVSIDQLGFFLPPIEDRAFGLTESLAADLTNVTASALLLVVPVLPAFSTGIVNLFNVRAVP